MKIDVRYATHPVDSKGYDTTKLREKYLVESIFVKDEVQFTYSHNDRIMAGGIMPVDHTVKLEAGQEMGVDYFLERRELGVINVGAPGRVIIDGKTYELGNRDGLYVGMGAKEVLFESVDGKTPAKFYLNSAPAHQTYPTVQISIKDASPLHLGDQANLNKRTIYQFVHPNVCKSCQLLMGMTILEPNNVWNTMPCHTHDRRMEVYFYFDMEADTRVFHFMGEPSETRHLVVANEQAVISPSWSIHSGVGTSNYTFIWGMVGENQTFADMDQVAMSELK